MCSLREGTTLNTAAYTTRALYTKAPFVIKLDVVALLVIYPPSVNTVKSLPINQSLTTLYVCNAYTRKEFPCSPDHPFPCSSLPLFPCSNVLPCFLDQLFAMFLPSLPPLLKDPPCPVPIFTNLSLVPCSSLPHSFLFPRSFLPWFPHSPVHIFPSFPFPLLLFSSLSQFPCSFLYPLLLFPCP